MNIDKAKLEALTSLSDDALWAEIRKMAGSHGLKLPEGTPPHSELKKLRDMCRADSKISMLQAMRIVNDLKRGK